MALETTVILRGLLYHIKTTNNVDKIRRYVEAMCSTEDIAVVEKLIAEDKED